ncbi:MAG: GspH/FimT family protein [Pseudomonadota bacterium]
MNYRAFKKLNKPTGFTLVELCTVIMLMGILGIAILPRFTSTQLFNNRGFSDQLKAAVEYARKSAVAERRNVCVTFAASISITRALASGSGAACTQPLINPTTGAGFSLTPPSSVTVASTVSPVIFSSLGDANSNATVTLTGSGAQSFAIIGTTGYVQ